MYGCISYKHIYASSRLGSINKDLGRPSSSISNLLMTQKAYTEQVIFAIKNILQLENTFFCNVASILCADSVSLWKKMSPESLHMSTDNHCYAFF